MQENKDTAGRSGESEGRAEKKEGITVEAVVEQKSEEMEEMKALLKEYLSQYYKKRQRKKILQKRLANFRAEMLGPKALNYSPVPRSKTNKVSDEPAQFCIKQEEIEERIEKERKLASSAMLKVMDLLDFLPEDSDEKNILELRYVDNMSWTDIAKTQSMSKSRCIDYWNIGLEKLLAFKKVRVLLEDYEKELRKNDRNSMKALAQVIGRATVLSGIYIGKQGESPAMATFRAKYTYLQQVSEEAAEEMYRSVIEEGISPDNILSISCMGYTHEQIQSMLRGNEAWHVVHLILHFRIYPRK